MQSKYTFFFPSLLPFGFDTYTPFILASITSARQYPFSSWSFSLFASSLCLVEWLDNTGLHIICLLAWWLVRRWSQWIVNLKINITTFVRRTKWLHCSNTQQLIFVFEVRMSRAFNFLSFDFLVAFGRMWSIFFCFCYDLKWLYISCGRVRVQSNW